MQNESRIMISQPQILYELLSKQTDGFRKCFEMLPIGVILADLRGTLVMINREAERIFGTCEAPWSPTDWVGGRDICRSDKKTRYLAGEVPLARSIGGAEVIGELMFVRNVSTGQELWIRVNSRPLTDDSGNLCGAVAVFLDVTELKRSVEQANLLSLAVEQTADSVVITDTIGAIEYVNAAFEATTGYTRQESLGKTPAILKSGQHVREFYAEMWKQILGGESFRGTLLNRRKNGTLYSAEQTITPIKNAEGHLAHFVSVLKDVTELRRHQEQDVQLKLARQVQQKLYTNPFSLPGLDTGAVALPMEEVGGDYFDFISTDKHSMTAVVGDVSGHGFAAAMVMALTRAYVRSSCMQGLDVETALTTVNNMLCADLSENRYITLVLVHFDLEARTLSYASAGHVPVLLLDASGEVQLLESTGTVLGLFNGSSFTSRSLSLQRGQIFVLLTDGVTDSGSPRKGQLGMDRVADYVRRHRSGSAQQIADGICRTARAFDGDDPQKDDIMAVVVKVAQ